MSEKIEAEIDGLFDQVEDLYDAGNYQQAIEIAEELCELVGRHYGNMHPDYATCRNNLGELYRLLGDYTAARLHFSEARAIREELLGPDHPDVAQSLNNLGELERAVGAYTAAERYHQQALEIRRKALSELHPDVAQSLHNLGRLHMEMGDYTTARARLQEATEIFRETTERDSQFYATSLSNLAELYTYVGDYAAAEPLYEEARVISREIVGEDHPDYAVVLNNLAGLYVRMGNYDKAESLYRQALEIDRNALGENHPGYATDLNNLAELYRQTGNYVGAVPLYERVLMMEWERRGDHPRDYAITLNNLAAIYDDIGDYEAAEAHYQEALDLLRTAVGRDHPLYATTLNNLGELYRKRNRAEAARVVLEEALAIRQEVLGEEHPDVGQSLSNLGLLYRETSAYGDAEPLLQRALAVRKKSLGKEHPEVAQTLANLASLYLDVGNYAAAESLYEQAREIDNKVLGENHPDNATALNNLAVLYVATHRPSEALALMRRAAEIDDQTIGQVFTIGSERQRMDYLATVQSRQDILLSFAIHDSGLGRSAVETGLDLVLRRNAIGAEALGAQRDAVLGGHYLHLRPRLNTLSTLRAQIAHRTLAGPGPEGLEEHQRLLEEWNKEREALEAELAREIPEMSLEGRLRTVHHQAVLGALFEGACLIQFVKVNIFDFFAVPPRGEPRWKPARYLAFVASSVEADNIHMIDLGEAEVIDQLVGEYRASIVGGERHLRPAEVTATRPSDGMELRAALFDPLVPAFGGRTRLSLAPDGHLTQLPFEVLPLKDGRSLIDHYQISYLAAGRDVLRFGAASGREPSAPFVVADPDFDLASDRIVQVEAQEDVPVRQSRNLRSGEVRFERLPGTRVEGEQIAALLGVAPLLEGAALESRLKAIRSPWILHIASHGFFLPDQQRDLNQEPLMSGAPMLATGNEWGRLSHGLENPLLRSGLALAGANTWLRERSLPAEAQDGILTAEEVTGLDLLNTELVVLSACETGLGQVQVGEGVFGLRRAFVLAGAKTLLMSLWKVPDRQTQELMVDFYGRILAGEPRAEALRGAQLALKARYPDPLYWGAFICQGDPGPLPSRAWREQP